MAELSANSINVQARVRQCLRLACICLFALVPWLAFASGPCNTGAPAVGESWRYRLLPGSYIADDCPVCDRPTFFYPIEGSFRLANVNENPLFTQFELRDIEWTTTADPRIRIAGQGTAQIGGEVAVTQDVELRVQLTRDGVETAKTFTNAVKGVSVMLPLLEIDLDQTDGTPLQFYRLHLLAAPFHEVWFSITASMTAGAFPPGANHVASTDLLAHAGRIVKSGVDLFRAIGIDPDGATPGLDALDVGPGGEVLFSLNADAASSTLGPLRHGDLLSDRARIAASNESLLAEFAPDAGTPDAGLDAVQWLAGGEVLFSITGAVASGKLGVQLSRGDLLSSTGSIVQRNRELLARFHPLDRDKDYGLDAVYAWPSGEIWFSVEEGFQDGELGVVLAGDLLSSQGRLLWRNLDLTSAFQPLEDLADFGLDALFVVTDAACPAPPLAIIDVAADRASGDVTLRWEGEGRVFLIEQTDTVTGEFAPLSGILPGLNWTHPGAAGSMAESFDRVRQW